MLQGRIEEIVAEGPARMSVAWQALPDGGSGSVEPDLRLPTASLFKIFVLPAVYRRAEAEGLDVHAERLTVDDHRSTGSGVLAFLDRGAPLTLYDLMVLMTIVSDNTATDRLLDWAGIEEVQGGVEALGLRNTRVGGTCGRLLVDLVGPVEPGLPNHELTRGAMEAFVAGQSDPFAVDAIDDEHNWTSASDVVRFCSILWSDDAAAQLGVSAGAVAEMRGMLERQQLGDDRFPRYLPMGTMTAHKTGTLPGPRHVATDGGVLALASGGVAALAVLTCTDDPGTYPADGPATFVDDVNRQIGLVARAVHDLAG